MKINEGKTRNKNYEMLRIVLMILIIIGHMVMYSEKLDDIGTLEYFITNFFRSFTMIAVNSFVLISGYFSINLKWNKLFLLDIRVCFYTWTGFLLAVILAIYKVNLIKDIQFLFPVITKQYWYITVYFVLCIFSPYINVFLLNISKRMLQKAILVGGVVLYLIATFCFLINANQIVLDAGYGIVNFVFLYCLGYYIKHYYIDEYKISFYLIIYIFACFFSFIINIGMTYITGFYFDSMISYNTIFALIGSLGLFMCFKNLNIENLNVRKGKIVLWLSSHSMAVYLIHMCPLIGSYFFKEILKIQSFNAVNLVIACIILPSIIYIICSMIDSIVDYIIVYIARTMKCSFKCFKRIIFK